MLLYITPNNYGKYKKEIRDMLELRHRVFKQRLDWKVEQVAGAERDIFDFEDATYILYLTNQKVVKGCIRLLPTIKPYMANSSFTQYFCPHLLPSSKFIWESSRFALEKACVGEKSEGLINRGTYEIFIGMLEFGLANKLTHILTLTDSRVERILRICKWNPISMSNTVDIGGVQSLIVALPICETVLKNVKKASKIKGNVSLNLGDLYENYLLPSHLIKDFNMPTIHQDFPRAL